MTVTVMIPLFPGLASCTEARLVDRSHRCPTCTAFERHLNAEIVAHRSGRAALAAPPSPVTADREQGGATRVAGAETTTTGFHAPTVVAASPLAADGDPASSASPPSPASDGGSRAGFGRGAEPPAPGRARHARPG